jgi:hypothetical protein
MFRRVAGKLSATYIKRVIRKGADVEKECELKGQENAD